MLVIGAARSPRIRERVRHTPDDSGAPGSHSLGLDFLVSRTHVAAHQRGTPALSSLFTSRVWFTML
eukprot:NODE_12673_length_1210_cov_4.600185.p6 GENE.NODE_12673_length_1210_cov_4.600185~~NODE_12673_length_1210_cov_4.600185.p6  ORF type:complete len:66 (+),score=8.66 NODE_12673_length_1210_cov_4.600185:283-480(+)